MKLKFDKLKQKKNIKGNVVKYINPKNKYLKVIKEVYLSELKPKTTKAWKINFTCDQYLTNLDGEFIFYYKKNLNEKKKQKKMNVYDAVFIPKKVFYGFKNNSKKRSLILNSLEVEHQKCNFGSAVFK
tara:strand:- start:166 stop:549 length:384 start_codon:yes stop_codon:yes gene_type:complete